MLNAVIQWYSHLVTIIWQNVDNIIPKIVFGDTTVWTIIEMWAHYTGLYDFFMDHEPPQWQASQTCYTFPWKVFTYVLIRTLYLVIVMGFNNIGYDIVTSRRPDRFDVITVFL